MSDNDYEVHLDYRDKKEPAGCYASILKIVQYDENKRGWVCPDKHREYDSLKTGIDAMHFKHGKEIIIYASVFVDVEGFYVVYSGYNKPNRADCPIDVFYVRAEDGK